MLTLLLLMMSVAFAQDLVWTPITPETQPGFLDETYMDPAKAKTMMLNSGARTLYGPDGNQLPESISFLDQRYRKKHQERLRVEREGAEVLFWDDKEKELLPLEPPLLPRQIAGVRTADWVHNGYEHRQEELQDYAEFSPLVLWSGDRLYYVAEYYVKTSETQTGTTTISNYDWVTVMHTMDLSLITEADPDGFRLFLSVEPMSAGGQQVDVPVIYLMPWGPQGFDKTGYAYKLVFSMQSTDRGVQQLVGHAVRVRFSSDRATPIARSTAVPGSPDDPLLTRARMKSDPIPWGILAQSTAGVGLMLGRGGLQYPYADLDADVFAHHLQAGVSLGTMGSDYQLDQALVRMMWRWPITRDVNYAAVGIELGAYNGLGPLFGPVYKTSTRTYWMDQVWTKESTLRVLLDPTGFFVFESQGAIGKRIYLTNGMAITPMGYLNMVMYGFFDGLLIEGGVSVKFAYNANLPIEDIDLGL
jgi:hypothetical protein